MRVMPSGTHHKLGARSVVLKLTAFLEAIGTPGRRYYASPELLIDSFYPPLYAASRGLALWWLTMPGRLREAAVAAEGSLRSRCSTLMASLDLFENGCIAVMLWTWPDLSHGLVEVSSLATRLKIMAGVFTEALMCALAVIYHAVGHMAWRCGGAASRVEEGFVEQRGTATAHAVMPEE
jgi:hypothetical protein